MLGNLDRCINCIFPFFGYLINLFWALDEFGVAEGGREVRGGFLNG